MRKIELKELENGLAGGMAMPPLNYAMVIQQVLSVKAEGMLIPELRTCLAVLSVMEKATATGVALLEEAEWNYLVERIQAHRWPMATSAVMTMIDDICTAAVFDPNT